MHGSRLKVVQRSRRAKCSNALYCIGTAKVKGWSIALTQLALSARLPFRDIRHLLMHDRKLETNPRGETLLSSPLDGQTTHPDRRPLHILATKTLSDDHVLVHYSDGSGALFETEELEKLRPIPKQVFSSIPHDLVVPATPAPVFAVTSTPEPEHPLVLGQAVA